MASYVKKKIFFNFNVFSVFELLFFTTRIGLHPKALLPQFHTYFFPSYLTA